MPSGSWFVPVVELEIALSIIYVALIAVRSSGAQIDRHGSFVVSLLIGLLHGLGFSFVLYELLLPNGAHLWKSLLSFNIGVEIGQVAIVLGVWIVLLIVGRLKKNYLKITRWVVALPCISVASFWMIERGKLLFDTFTVG